MSSLNELYKRLDILPPLHQSVCIGYSQRKPTCGCAVALSSRESADRALKDVFYDLSAGNCVQASYLERIASLLLCRRFHQGQADGLVGKWQSALHGWSASSRSATSEATTDTEHLVSVDQYKAIEAELRSIRDEKEVLEAQIDKIVGRLLQHDGFENILTSAAYTPLPRTHAQRLDIQRVDDEAFITELGRRIEQGTNFSSNMSLLNATTQLHGSAGTFTFVSSTTTTAVPAVSPLLLQGHDNVRNAPLASQPPRTRRRRPIIRMPLSLSGETEESNLETTQLRQDISSLADSNRLGSTSNTEYPVDEPAVLEASEGPPIRQSHMECAVCCESYGQNDTEANWECGTCQNRTHNECFLKWAEAAGNQNVRCIYCRAAV